MNADSTAIPSGYMITLADLILRENSSLVIHSSTVLSIAPVSCSSMYLTGNVTIANSSRLALMSSNFSSGVGPALRADGCSVTIVNLSSWHVFSCRVTSTSDDALFAQNSQFSFVDRSDWTLKNSVFAALHTAFFLFGPPVRIAAESSWAIASCTFTSSNIEGFSLKSAVTVIDHSLWVLSSCLFSAANAGVVGYTLAVITIANSSSWVFDSSTLGSDQNAGFYLSAASLRVSNASDLVFQKCEIHGLVSAWSIAGSSLVFDDNSTLRFSDCRLWSALSSISIGNSAVVFSRRSSWVIETSTFTSGSLVKGSAVIIFINPVNNYSLSTTTLQIDHKSTWLISYCTITATQATSSIVLNALHMTISNGSAWIISDCTATSAAGDALVFQSSTVAVTMSSELQLLRNFFSSSSGVSLKLMVNSQLTVAGLSVWAIVNSSLAGGGSQGSVLASGDCALVLANVSVMIVAGVTIVSSPLSARPAAVTIVCGVTIGGSSLLMLRGNVMQTASVDKCVDLGKVILKDWGMVRILDNECTASSRGADFLVGSIVGPSTSFPLLVDRCNTVNGALRLGMWRAMDISGCETASLPCSRCDKAVDCFWPLTELSQFTRIQCGGVEGHHSLEPECPCLAECNGAGSMCLPGSQTLSTEGRVVL